MVRLLMIGLLAVLPATALAADGATGASAGTVAADPAANEIICKKRTETGSLVRKKKECFTKAEWEKIVESQVRGTRRMADELMGGSNCRSGGEC